MGAVAVAELPRPGVTVRRPIRVGLISGAVGIYLAATGIIERFEARNIIFEVIQMGDLILLIVLLMAGLLAVRSTQEAHSLGATSALYGAVSGAVAGGLVAAFLLVARFLIDAGMNVREILINVTPGLLNEILTFGQGVGVGVAVLVGAGALVGAAGAGFRTLPTRPRKALTLGLMVTLVISLGEPLFRPMLGGLGIESDWLYRRGGLTLTSTLLVFLISTGVTAAWLFRGHVVKDRVGALPQNQRKVMRMGSLLLLILVLLALPQVVGPFVSNVLGDVGLYVLLGLGLNIVVGYAGLLDLGYVAFFAVGAYTTGVLTSPASFLVTEPGQQFSESGLGLTNFWVALPVVVITAVAIGVLIGAPVLRLRGDYLAIVTLGFGEIIRTLVLSDWLAPFLGGAQGLTAVPEAPPAALHLRQPERIYYLILAFVILAAFISVRLADSRVGRAWNAMREDESVAEAMGISVIKYKLLAFAMGAGIGCLGGAFFAAKIGSIFPNSFGLLVSINVLAVIILGGMGSIPGVVVGALVLVGLPDLLREFGEYRLLVYGAILVAIMIYRPAGLIPNVRRRQELSAEEPEEEQYERGAPAPEPVITTGPAGPGGSQKETP